MKLSATVSFVLVMSITFVAFAEQLPSEAERMLNDLGNTPDIQQMNNGKPLRCRFGGRKTVSISPLQDATLFSGEYDNCREAAITRDGYYEIIVRDWEIIGESSKRSRNGELQDAVRNGDVKKARLLIAQHADVNYAESITLPGVGAVERWTPLMSAATTGNAGLVKLLIKAGAWINYMNSRAVSALWLAAGSGSIESVKLLVTNGAYINNSNYEDVTPLMSAAMLGHYQVAKYLVDSKADINRIHKDGDSALMFALANSHTDIAKMLIDSGADINIRNRFGATALLIAISENNQEMVQKLIQLKADLTVRTDSGKSALDIALVKGNQSIIEIIRQAQTGIK